MYYGILLAKQIPFKYKLIKKSENINQKYFLKEENKKKNNWKEVKEVIINLDKNLFLEFKFIEW